MEPTRLNASQRDLLPCNIILSFSWQALLYSKDNIFGAVSQYISDWAMKAGKPSASDLMCIVLGLEQKSVAEVTK